MFDFSQLEQLAKPCGGMVIGSPPLRLDEVFARVVADGWAPRRPAFGAELDRCEVAATRGTCLEPLIVDGDEVFVDPRLAPLPGDLVSFALSERGAEAQGDTSLPPGKSRWQKGDRWVKLFVPYLGVADMLLEKTGNSATTTLLGGEHPDDHPALWPVRNIARRGKLLFTPDMFTNELGPNAAGQILSVFDSAGFSVTAFKATNFADFSTGGVGADSCVITTIGSPVAVDLSVGVLNILPHTGVVSWSVTLTVRRDGSTITQAPVMTISSTQVTWTAGSYVSLSPLATMSVVDTPAAGSHQYGLYASCTDGAGDTGALGTALICQSILTKVREIRR